MNLKIGNTVLERQIQRQFWTMATATTEQEKKAIIVHRRLASCLHSLLLLLRLLFPATARKRLLIKSPSIPHTLTAASAGQEREREREKRGERKKQHTHQEAYLNNVARAGMSRPFVILLPNCGSRGIETRAFFLGQTVSCLGRARDAGAPQRIMDGAFRRGAALMASYHHRETSPLADPIVLGRAAPFVRSLGALFYCARAAVRGFFRCPTF